MEQLLEEFHDKEDELKRKCAATIQAEADNPHPGNPEDTEATLNRLRGYENVLTKTIGVTAKNKTVYEDQKLWEIYDISLLPLE